MLPCGESHDGTSLPVAICNMLATGMQHGETLVTARAMLNTTCGANTLVTASLRLLGPTTLGDYPDNHTPETRQSAFTIS